MGASTVVIQPSVHLVCHHVHQHGQQGPRYPQLPPLPSQPTAVLAPGGYTVLSPAEPPAQLPTPFIDCQRHSCCQQKQKGQHCQHQQCYAASAETRICVGQPVCRQTQQQQLQGGKATGCCRNCTLGWVLYGLGWMLPICWVAAIMLPFCTKSQESERRAAVASGVTLGVLAVVAVLVTVAVMSVAAATPAIG